MSWWVTVYQEDLLTEQPREVLHFAPVFLLLHRAANLCDPPAVSPLPAERCCDTDTAF